MDEEQGFVPWETPLVIASVYLPLDILPIIFMIYSQHRTFIVEDKLQKTLAKRLNPLPQSQADKKMEESSVVMSLVIDKNVLQSIMMTITEFCD